MRRRLRRYRLRHKIHAIKTRPNNPLRFLQHKNSIRHYLTNDLTCAARKTTFRTRKRFHNKQYPPKSKVQPHGSDRPHLTQGLTTATLQCTVKPLFFFFFIKTQPFNKKPKQNYIKQLQQTTHTISQSKTSSNKPSKQTRQTISSIVKSITQTITTKITHTISKSKTRSKQTQQSNYEKCNVFKY